jgi:hemoglobin
MAVYDDVGGARGVRAVLDAFYPRVLSDEMLSPFFLGVDIERLKNAQARFFAFALGGPGQDIGRGLADVHARTRQRGVNDAVFDHYVGVFKGVLVDLGVPHTRFHEWLRFLESKRGQILNR